MESPFLRAEGRVDCVTMKVRTNKDDMVVVGIDPQGAWDFTEEITPLEAERLIRDLRRAIDKVRSDNAPKKRLGDY